MPPNTSADFDRAYRLPVTLWGDVRIPDELKTLARWGSPRSVLELGCGVGRFSRYMARQGLRATGVDFSPVAIAKAKAASGDARPEFQVGDVTQLNALSGSFDASFDVGCFHCLDPIGQRKYAAEVHRLLAPGGIHLIWAMDDAPAGLALSPAAVKEIFAPAFELKDAQKSRRRFASSHWYWLVSASGDARH